MSFLDLRPAPQDARDRARVSADEARAIEAALAAGRVTRCAPGYAAGTSKWERETWTSPVPIKEGQGWRTPKKAATP